MTLRLCDSADEPGDHCGHPRALTLQPTRHREGPETLLPIQSVDSRTLIQRDLHPPIRPRDKADAGAP